MNPLQKASAIRKVYYLSAILALFTISMFWRGIIPIPLSDTARASEPRSGVTRIANQISSHTILNQSRALDLRELEQGEPEVEGEIARLLLLGSNGAAVTWTWYSIMDKQKRNDFHEMERLVQVATRLQPHFITPWIFQSWNIAYNVSVEMQGSGDMYHYIARGIDLLAEGERRNTHTYEGRRIGSPDMRYQIAFYYQNKFGVSDQVEVLRCLFQLSCMSPDDRNPDALMDKATNTVDLAKFREFCTKYPHFVRRLRGEDKDALTKVTDDRMKQKIQEALKCSKPEEIVQFLRDNRDVPSRFKYARELADPDRQFPSVPPKFDEDEVNPSSKTEDNFSAYLVARAWYKYALVPVPPPPRDSDDQPLPFGAPRQATRPGELRLGEYDPLRYRVPRQPMLIIFRQGAPRSQSSQAELEQKEGWFDSEGWRIDDPQDQPDKWWFPDPEAPAGSPRPLNLVVGGGSRPWSLEEWQKAARMWRTHGEENGQIISPERLERYKKVAREAPMGMPGDPTEEDLADPTLRRQYEAKVALFYYSQNRGVTNFPFFLASSQAEAREETVMARKILWQAEQARKLARTTRATDLYEDGLKRWKAVLAKDAEFHRPERSDRIEDETYTYELAYLRLLVQDDARVRARARELALKYAQVLAAGTSVLPFKPFPVTEWKKDALEDIKWYVAETEFSPFAQLISEKDGVTDRERLNTPWVRPEVKDAVRTAQGVQRKSEEQPKEQAQQSPQPRPEPRKKN
jgi:hypothetical protein